MARWHIEGIRVPVDEGESGLAERVARLCGAAPGDVRDLRVVRRSIDARGRGTPRLIYAVEALLPLHMHLSGLEKAYRAKGLIKGRAAGRNGAS